MSEKAVRPLQLLRLSAVLSRVGLSKSQIYRMIKAGDFPAPISIGANSVRWPSHDIDAWITGKLVVSGGGAQV